MTGETLGNRYKLLEQLGGGGMAVVYKAVDTYLDRTVTVKILRSEYASDESFVTRFRKEAQSVARLSHPNIVNIHDVGTEGDIHYLVMEFVEGQNLKSIIRSDAPMPAEKVVNLARQVCDALQHAHDNGIVHRDVKPHNILITAGGKAKLTDFGIAKEVTASTLTYGDNVMGSVHYLSPEQARGEMAGPASDIYSLGVVIYEMLTGMLPFEGDTPIGVAMKHINEDTRPLQEINSEIPPGLALIVDRAMQKEAGDRFASAGEMGEALVRSLNGDMVYPFPGDGLKARLMVPVYKIRQMSTRQKRLTLLISIPLATILIIVAGVYALNQYINTPNITVPAVEGKDIEEARKILAQKDLKAKVINKVPSEEKEDIVIFQNIGPGDYPVKPGREIELTVSKGPDMRTVPDLKGKNQSGATAALLEKGLVLEVPVEREYSDNVEEGLVIAQSPRPGETLPRGSKVKVIISMGPETENREVPDLVGKKKDTALKLLRSSGLEFAITWEDSKKYPSGVVIKQKPASGAKVDEGGKVQVVISSGPGPGTDETTVKIYDEIPDDGKSHNVKIIVDDAGGSRVEYTNTHVYGDQIIKTIEYQGTAKIKVYVDSRLEEEKIAR